MKNIFKEEIVKEVLARMDKLTPETQAVWGTMSVGQMLAHCNVTYEMLYTDKHPKPNAFKRFMLKTFVKKIVVGDKEYAKNSRTAPQFVITESKDFEKEKERLAEFITKTEGLGEKHFDGLESHSFGVLAKEEWNNMFYKHLDHHLSQFGV